MSAALPSRLAVDGRMLVHPAPTGVGTYARELRQAMRTLLPSTETLVDWVGPTPNTRSAVGRPLRWLHALAPTARRLRSVPDMNEFLLHSRDVFRIAQIHFDIYGRLLPLRVDGASGLIHWAYPVPLRIVGWSNVYTVHDMIPLLHPELSPIDPVRHRRLLETITDKAAGLVTVSDSSMRDIITMLNVPPERVRNCGTAVVVGKTPVLPAFLADRPFLLVLGTVEPRKNIGRLCEAFRRSGVRLRLIIAGPDGHAVGDFGTGDILRLPYISETLAHALTGHARALLMPSLAEGFGLPIVEAMARGTPVVTSAGGATEEIAGGAALLVDPYDGDALAVAIRRIAADDALRHDLIAKGRSNAARFSRLQFANRLASAYRAFGGDPSLASAQHHG